MIARLAAAFAACLVLLAAAPAPRIGVEMPQAGDDGGRGLAAQTAVRLALRERIVVRDTSSGGFQNPHRDEGSDNDVDVRTAPKIIRSFARDSAIVAAIGGLRRNVGDADAVAAERANLPFVTLHRWWRGRSNRPNAFCVCLSPALLLAGARQIATVHFGRRLLIVLVGDAAKLRLDWADALSGTSVANGDDPMAVLRAHAAGVDAVIVIADERPLIAMRSAVFRGALVSGYLQQLVHRGFSVNPTSAARGDVLVISERTLPNDPARRDFARRFHAAAGYQPSDEALRAYAAAQILAHAGTSRDAVRGALRSSAFPTAAGLVRFERDGYWDRSMISASPP